MAQVEHMLLAGMKLCLKLNRYITLATHRTSNLDSFSQILHHYVSYAHLPIGVPRARCLAESACYLQS